MAKLVTTNMNRRPALAVRLAFAGLLTAIISMSWAWSRLTSATPPLSTRLWPLPGLYVVEAVALPAVVFVAVAAHAASGAWLSIGALTLMALLGAMSIGFNMALALVFLIPAALVVDDGRSTVSRKAAAFAIGALLQGSVMFSMIQHVLRRPMSGP